MHINYIDVSTIVLDLNTKCNLHLFYSIIFIIFVSYKYVH